MRIMRIMRIMKTFVTLVASLLLAGCTVDERTAPSLTGPSEFGLSVSLTALPDRLPRDGTSQAVVTVTVRDASGRPAVGQQLFVSTNAGAVSEGQIVTGAEGRASFVFVAPAANSGLNEAVVQVTPAEADASNAVPRSLIIPLTGTAGVTSITAPTASFTFSPATPAMGDSVSFDASGTMDEGARCLDACTYSWNFGDEATASGRIVSYGFRGARTYAVTLTVVDAAGSVGTQTRNVVVSQGTLPTASFTFSPTSPGQFETVNFTAAASSAGAGRTITNFQWRFGDGSTATGVTASHAYNILGTFVVVLTVTDSAGLTGTTSQNVTVVNGVTADFTISRDSAPVNKEVFFDAEASKGSSTGFGGRNPIVKYIWSFGDSTSVTETTSRIEKHTYTETGTYTINLTVEDSAGRRNTKSKTLKVE